MEIVSRSYKTFTLSYFFLINILFRQLLKTVLQQVTLNDQLSMKSEFLKEKHEKLLFVIKKILFVFYGFNLVDAFFIYLPHRSNVSNNYYSMTPCVGKSQNQNLKSDFAARDLNIFY